MKSSKLIIGVLVATVFVFGYALYFQSKQIETCHYYHGDVIEKIVGIALAMTPAHIQEVVSQPNLTVEQIDQLIYEERTTVSVLNSISRYDVIKKTYEVLDNRLVKMKELFVEKEKN